MAHKAIHDPSAETVNSAILTKRQAAEYLQVSARYIERMVRLGRLRALKPSGKFWRVRRSDIDAFLESGATIGGVGTETLTRSEMDIRCRDTANGVFLTKPQRAATWNK